MSLASLLSIFSGTSPESAEFAKLEADAKALVGNLTSVMTAVVAGKGDIVSTIVGVVEDIGAIKNALEELVTIASDVRALADGVSSTVNGTAPAAPAAPAAPVAPVPPAPPAPVTASSVVAAALAVAQQLDPFAPKPLAKASSVVEPHGGA